MDLRLLYLALIALVPGALVKKGLLSMKLLCDRTYSNTSTEYQCMNTHIRLESIIYAEHYLGIIVS